MEETKGEKGALFVKKESQKLAVAYLRVSQKDESIENQKKAIEEWAKKNGIIIVAWFKDEDVSGTIPPRQREGYRAMLKFCEDNNIKTIVFYDLSRLARNVIEGVREIYRLMEEGYDIYTLDRVLELLNQVPYQALKKIFLSMLLGFYEMYVEDIKRRTKTALEGRKLEGKIIGRPTIFDAYALWMFRKERYNQLTKEEREKAKQILINMIKQWRKEGKSIQTIRALLQKEFEKVNDWINRINKKISNQEDKLHEIKIAYSTVHKIVKEIEKK